MWVHTITNCPGQDFPKEVEIEEVILIDGRPEGGLVAAIHILKQCNARIHKGQREKIKKLSEKKSETKRSIKICCKQPIDLLLPNFE